MILAENISFQISGKSILRNISFEAFAGELVVILGSNGAGKSTLLKILSGELKPSSGNVAISQKNLAEWTVRELAQFRAVLPQQTILMLPFSVTDVVMMGRYPHFKDKPYSIDYAIVKNVLTKTGIIHLAKRNYLTLSGGEQQRVHLARVLSQVQHSQMVNTKYLLMDEPVNNLDILHQHTTLQLVKAFAKEGNCVVAVLHDLNLAMQYADKILMLKNGEMVCFDDVKTALNNTTISHAYDFPLHVVDYPCQVHPVIVPAFINN